MNAFIIPAFILKKWGLCYSVCVPVCYLRISSFTKWDVSSSYFGKG